MQVSNVSPLIVSKSRQSQQSMHDSKQRGMAAELADILSQLDDAAKLADQLDYGVNSRSQHSYGG